MRDDVAASPCPRGAQGSYLSTGPNTPLIELCKISKAYAEGAAQRVVLKELSVEFYAGELVVLMGRSGSGKSTLLNLISGIDLPTRGRVLLSGMCLNEVDDRTRTLYRRRYIGFVFQSFNLIPSLTVGENILLPLQFNGITGNEAEHRVSALLEQLGMAGRDASFPDCLSGGEQQRIAIARALVHEPVLVLADEPTGNLDVDTGKTVLNLMEHLVRTAGKTLIMVSHDPEVTRIADRIFTLEHGQLREARLAH